MLFLCLLDLLQVFSRIVAKDLLETLSEITDAVHAYAKSGIADRTVFMEQQMLGVFHSVAADIFVGAHAREAFHLAIEG